MSVVTKATNAIGFSSLKKEQEKVINEYIIVAGKDVFLCLLTVPTHKPFTFRYSLDTNFICITKAR